jgi:hypothetical protein
MKKVAIPVKNEILCDVFEHATQFKVFTTENQKIKDDTVLIAPHHQFGLFPFWLQLHDITDVIAHSIKHETINKFNCLKTNVFVGVEIKEANELLHDFMHGNLETNAEVCDNAN